MKSTWTMWEDQMRRKSPKQPAWSGFGKIVKILLNVSHMRAKKIARRGIRGFCGLCIATSAVRVAPAQYVSGRGAKAIIVINRMDTDIVLRTKQGNRYVKIQHKRLQIL